MPLNFPSNPAVNDLYTFGGRTWIWNGSAWDSYNSGITEYVSKLNGFTGGITLAEGSNVTVSSSNNIITISSTGVQSFNGLTGAVSGVTTSVANTFTELQSFDAGISGSALQILGGVTFGPYSYILGGEFAPNISLNPITIDSAKVQIGDVNGTVNGLKFIVDNSNPDNNTAYLYGNLTVQPTQAPYSSGGGIYSIRLNTNTIVPYTESVLQLGNSNSTVQIGDNGEGNGTKIYVRDQTQILDLINANGIINIGDVNNLNNSTKLIVNDTTNTVSVNGNLMTTGGATFGTIYASNIVNSFNGKTGAVSGVTQINAGSGISISGTTNPTITNTGVIGFNGLTGAVSGVTAVNAGTGISISGSTNPTITNTGVQSFNGLTGAVTGVTTSVANTFTALQTFNRGITSAGATFNGNVNFGAGTVLTVDTINSNAGTNLTVNNVASSVTNIGNASATYLSVDDTSSIINAGAPVRVISGLNTGTLNSGSIAFYNGTRTQTISPTFTGTNTTITIPATTTTLTGNAIANTFTALQTFNTGITSAGATFNGNVAMTSTSSHTGLASFAGGISASGATFTGNIILQNSEFIRNTTDGRIDLMPAPAAANAYGLSVDMTSWGFGPRIGTIKSSDNTTNNAQVLWDVPIVVGNDTAFSLGSSQAYKFYMSSIGNDTLQAAVPAGVAGYSSALALVDYAQIGAGNRSPATAHTNPNLYIYSAGAANANDFVRIEHDRTNANIVTGQTSGILIQPGSGWLGVSGGISASSGITFNSTSYHGGLATFMAGATFTGQVTVNTFKANTIGGDEGGQIDFGLAATNTSVTGGVAIDIYQNKLRFFETGGNNRGAYLDLTNLPSGVGTDLANRATTTPIGITNATNLYAITYPDGVTSNRSDRTAWYRSFVETSIEGAGRAVRANRTYFRIQNVNKDTAIKSVRITSANTGVTGNCYFSIWSCDPTSGFPNTRLYLSASTAVGSGYNKTTVTNASGLVTVPSGKWWLAVTFDSTPTVYCGSAYYYNPYLGAPDYYSGYRFQGAIADTSTYTVPSAIPASGVTFGFIEYTAGQNYFEGAIGLEWIPV